MARYFFALDIKDADKKRIAHLQQQIAPPLPKPAKARNLHLTLVFLGQLSPEQLAPLLKKAKQLSHTYHALSSRRLNINHIGLFDQAKVLYLGLDKTPHWLSGLVSELESDAINQGLNINRRRYQPHITISRKARELPEQTPVDLSIEIGSFSLYVSESTPNGVCYTPLETFSLITK